MNQNQALPAGTRLQGHSYAYEIERVLGQGSFGITYRARLCLSGELGELSSNVTVAVKEFFMKDINGREGTSVTSGSDTGVYSDYKTKFKREAVNLSRMKHPGIVKVLEAFEANNTFYYAMEYIEGGSLDKYIGEWGGLPEREALDYLERIGSALAFMHDNRMLHLDLKPLNVMRRADGQPVLIDFGLSKQYGSDGQPESSTTIGGGTPGYAPLEQANYHEGRDFPVTLDVYALGATLYKMLTGQTPPVAADVLNDGFPEESLLRKQVSRKTIEALRKAMSPMKKERWQTVGELLGALGCEVVPRIVSEENTRVKEKDPVCVDDEKVGGKSIHVSVATYREDGCSWIVLGVLSVAVLANMFFLGGYLWAFTERGSSYVYPLEILPIILNLWGIILLCRKQKTGLGYVLFSVLLAVVYGFMFWDDSRGGTWVSICLIPVAVAIVPALMLKGNSCNRQEKRKEALLYGVYVLVAALYCGLVMVYAHPNYWMVSFLGGGLIMVALFVQKHKCEQSVYSILKGAMIKKKSFLIVMGLAWAITFIPPFYYIKTLNVKKYKDWATVLEKVKDASEDGDVAWSLSEDYSDAVYSQIDLVNVDAEKATYWRQKALDLKSARY